MHKIGRTIFSCNTTFYMFSGVRNPFLDLFLSFEVIFKGKGHFHTYRLVPVYIKLCMYFDGSKVSSTKSTVYSIQNIYWFD